MIAGEMCDGRSDRERLRAVEVCGDVMENICTFSSDTSINMLRAVSAMKAFSLRLQLLRINLVHSY